jgi:uncharacterized membrane protein YhiD involved in acid resistance
MQMLTSFLNKFTLQEREVLHKLLATKNNDVNEITLAFSKLSLPANGLLQTKLSYNQILDKIVKRNSLQIHETNKISEKESEIFQKLFTKEFENLTAIEKEEFIKNLEKNGLDKNQIASITSIAAITAAQVSGFGIYLLASSTVGAITGVLGVTLPFAFYTGMSSVIATVIGPIGFLVLGYGAYRSFKHVKSWDEANGIFKQTGVQLKKMAFGDMETTQMAFKYIASMRIIKIKELEDKVNFVVKNIGGYEVEKKELILSQEKISSKIEDVKNKIDVLKKEIESLNNQVDLNNNTIAEFSLEYEEVDKQVDALNAEIIASQTSLNKGLKEIDFLKNN